MNKGLAVYKAARETLKRYRVLYGGAGSGKSVTSAQFHLDAAMSGEKERILVIRKVARTIRHSTFALFRDVIDALRWNGEVNVHKGDMKIEFRNGNEIIHAGLDDVEKLKLVTGITRIWIEEATEVDIEDLAQLDLRLRGDQVENPQITLTFNPVFTARKIFDYIGFPTADLPSRGFKENEDAFVQHSTFEDNKHAGKKYSTALRRLASVSQAMHDIYYLGLLAISDEPDQLIKYEWVKRAFETDPSLVFNDGRQRLGVDVGRLGDDPSVIAHLEGYVLNQFIKYPPQRTSITGHSVGNYIRENGIPSEFVGVDAVGLGAGVLDTLYDDGIEAVEIIGGASPLEYVDLGTPISVVNLRSQMYWYMRHLFEEGLVAIQEDNEEYRRLLQEDLLAPRYRFVGEKVVEVEPKESKSKDWGLKSRLGRSPDFGDSLAYGLFVDRYLIEIPDDEYEEPQEEGVFAFEMEDDDNAVFL